MPKSYNWYERDWLECAESAYDNNAILSPTLSISPPHDFWWMKLDAMRLSPAWNLKNVVKQFIGRRHINSFQFSTIAATAAGQCTWRRRWLMNDDFASMNTESWKLIQPLFLTRRLETPSHDQLKNANCFFHNFICYSNFHSFRCFVGYALCCCGKCWFFMKNLNINSYKTLHWWPMAISTQLTLHIAYELCINWNKIIWFRGIRTQHHAPLTGRTWQNAKIYDTKNASQMREDRRRAHVPFTKPFGSHIVSSRRSVKYSKHINIVHSS